MQQILGQNHPIVMGIINATPDSFYDSGQSLEKGALSQQIDEFNQQHVHMIDIGAESSRPGSTPISSNEEISRLRQVLPRILSETSAIISIDTYKPEVASYALSEGAHIINDISGGASDQLLDIVAQNQAGIILMHKQGSPETMQDDPSYTNVVTDIHDYLSEQVSRARSFGIDTIIIDPGIGFGKTLEQNLLILKHIGSFSSIECPILIGTSNKSFIEHLTGALVHERLSGSIASVLACYQQGAHIFRVHNVKETMQALTVFKAINE